MGMARQTRDEENQLEKVLLQTEQVCDRMCQLCQCDKQPMLVARSLAHCADQHGC